MPRVTKVPCGGMRFGLTFLLVAGCASACPAAAEVGSANDGALLKRVLDDWQRRREQVRTVRYSVSGKCFYPKDAFDGHPGIPPGAKGVALKADYTHDFSGRWLIDFAENRFRIQYGMELFNISELKWKPDGELYVFDGDELRCHLIGVSENRGTHYSYVQQEFRYHTLDRPILTNRSRAVFLAHGVVLPAETMEEIGNIGSPLGRNRFTIHGNAVLQGTECTVLRTSPDERGRYLELWVDLQRDSAVLRVQEYSRDRRVNRTDIDFHEAADGWFPKGWTCTEIRGGSKGTPFRIITVSVDDFELNPQVTAADFTLEPAPGMIVRNDLINKSYKLGPHGEHLPYGESPSSGKDPARRRLVLAGLLVVVVACAAGFLLYRRRSARVAQ